jgi:hypothetical protein
VPRACTKDVSTALRRGYGVAGSEAATATATPAKAG